MSDQTEQKKASLGRAGECRQQYKEGIVCCNSVLFSISSRLFTLAAGFGSGTFEDFQHFFWIPWWAAAANRAHLVLNCVVILFSFHIIFQAHAPRRRPPRRPRLPLPGGDAPRGRRRVNGLTTKKKHENKNRLFKKGTKYDVTLLTRRSRKHPSLHYIFCERSEARTLYFV